MVEPVEDSQSWAVSNFGLCELGDQRRTNRAVQIARRMADNPSGSSPRQITEWSELKACYRFFNSESVTFDALARPHWDQTRESARGRVLIICDTTEMSYSQNRKIQGLGPVGKGSTIGFFLHNALMATAETGEILGLAQQELFHRVPAPSKENRRQRSRRPRESEIWGQMVDAIGAPALGNEYIHVCDRGADNLELFCHLREQHCQWVIRCSHLNRHVQPLVNGNLGSLICVEDALAESRILGTASLSLRSREGMESRVAQLEIRCCEVSIPQPDHRSPYLRSINFRSLSQTLVEIRELNPPKGATALRWVLWTSLPIQTLDDALEVIHFYEQRWLIEEFHKAIKTGCQFETRQYQTSHCLEALAGMTSVLAVRLLMMKQLARIAPETPAKQIVPQEWLRVAEILRSRQLPTVRDFMRNLAALGGFLMRKHDGEPGWITIWRGTEVLLTSLKFYSELKAKCG